MDYLKVFSPHLMERLSKTTGTQHGSIVTEVRAKPGTVRIQG